MSSIKFSSDKTETKTLDIIYIIFVAKFSAPELYIHFNLYFLHYLHVILDIV